MHGALLMTLLVGCGSDPTGGSSTPPTDDPASSGASANGKTPVKDPATSTSPTGTGTPTQDPAAGTMPATPTAKPTFAWAPDFADFAETMLGETTKPQTVTLTNTSDVDAADVGLRLNGSQFVLGATDCAGALKAHGACQAEVSFHPTLAIAAEGFLYLALNKSDQGAVAVHLTGTGKEAPMDPGMTTNPAPGTYGVCPIDPPAPLTYCHASEYYFTKDGLRCALCLVGTTQECSPSKARGILCVTSCGECK